MALGMALDERKVLQLINEAVRAHEIRVAITSGALGAALLLGIFHAIFLLHHELRLAIVQS